MAKKNVPQEQVDAIIDAYVNKQYGLQKIVRELKLPFGPSVVKRVLQENNIHIRSLQEASKIVGLHKRIEVPQELQEEIIKLYNQGYGLDRIVKELQLAFSFEKVRSILQENGIHIRNVKESAQIKIMPDLRKYPINDEYSLETHNGAWLLGFIAADGYLPLTKGAKNKIVISLQRRDEDILHMIAEEINYKGPIHQYESSELNGKRYPFSSLSFTSKELRQKIEKYGIVNAKTFKLSKIPDLPKEYKIDFIRGFFDGDGSLYEPVDKKINTNIICARAEFLDSIASFLEEEYGIPKPKIHPTKSIFEIKYYTTNSFKLCDLFYNNDFLALPRKKEHYFQIKEKYNML